MLDFHAPGNTSHLCDFPSGSSLPQNFAVVGPMPLLSAPAGRLHLVLKSYKEGEHRMLISAIIQGLRKCNPLFFPRYRRSPQEILMYIRWSSGYKSTCQYGGHRLDIRSLVCLGNIPHAAGQLSQCTRTTEPWLQSLCSAVRSHCNEEPVH